MNTSRIFDKRLKNLEKMQVPLPQNHHEFLVFCQQLSPMNTNPAIYLEIGSRHGGSLYVASGFLPKGSTIISIDLPNSAWGIPNSELTLNKVCKKLIAEGYDVYQILANSQSRNTKKRILDILNNRNLDALFVDGDHTLKAVTSDWDNYSPLVKQNGIIAFHDIAHSADDTGVEVGQIWSKLAKSHIHLEIIFEHGIGILWKK